ncbi:MAG TPA: histidine kinase [Albitalea sp.]|nr:histidine kinase [Albitalea sp.]
MAASAPSLPAPEDWRRQFARRGVRVLLIGAVISALVSFVFAHSPFYGLAYGMSISMLCWFFIDGGRLVVAGLLHRRAPPGADPASARWPGWPVMSAIIVVGTFLGYSFGNVLGNWITGHNSPGLLNIDFRRAFGILLLSTVPGGIFTYAFYSRAMLAKSEAAAQTAQRQAAENQLKLLESQLEPHMLFNTLANLRVLIGIDPPRAQLMLDRLIAFLRATLNASRATMQPLAAEFARVADYAALMQIRMGDRLQPQLDLPADLAALPVPPLLLQPLVENAIKHGLEPHVNGGRLIVSAARDGEHLVLQVRDTGAGLSAVPADGTNFGLQQVRERIATLYGTAASLELAPAGDAEGGALATVRIPIPRASPT